ncbi:hypothetical protein D3C78_16970 [compost metagenome]
MANLSDMEELLHNIENEQIRDYMHEALTCYMTKAYRGCIVLSFIALFDDIFSKLESLAKINKTASDIYNSAKNKRDNQDVYETDLINQLKSKNLLPEIDSEFAEILRILRNKSAHPSGHKPSAEEARYVFYEVINRFLSKPIFSTIHLVNEIIDRIDNVNIFIDKNFTSVAEVVAEEIASLHPEAILVLVSKLLSLDVHKNNVRLANRNFFIVGLAIQNNINISNIIQDKVVKAKCDDEEYDNLISGIITANPNIFKSLTGIKKSRVKNTISKSISNKNLALGQKKLDHPINVLMSLSEIYEDDEFLKEFELILKNIFKKAPSLIKLSNILKDKPKTFNEYINILTLNVGSSDFDTANYACDNILESEKIYIDYISEEQAFKLIVAIIKSNKHGAFKSENILKSNFLHIKKTKEMAIKYISDNNSAAQHYFTKIVGEDLSKYSL